MQFKDLELHPLLQKALDDKGFEKCTEIQEKAIPLILEGRDISGLAQTGTGKTGAFLLPLIDRLLRSKDAEDKRAFKDFKDSEYFLILVPTRELAEQVMENCKDFCKHTDFKSVSIYGGTSYDKQKDLLSQGVQFVIATPGRLIDLFKNDSVDLKQVRAVVFDEADRMFDMGFKDDMKYVLKRIPKDRQFLVFSATMNFDVLNTAYEVGADPVEININQDQATAGNVEDHILHVGDDEKGQFLISLIKKENAKQVIIFSNFKHQVERIVHFLNKNDMPALGISSLLNQAQRNRAMAAFKESNDQNILVATDVAARGLDVKGVDLVVNYELPGDSENYVHRIGRTGRADSKGTAFSLVSEKDVDSLSRIQDYLKKKLEVLWLENDELIKDFKPFSTDRDQRDSKRRQYKDQNKKGYEGGGGRGKKKSKSGGNRNRKPYDKDRKSRDGEDSVEKRPYNKKRRTKKPYKKSEDSDSTDNRKKNFSKKKKTGGATQHDGPKRRKKKKLNKGQKRVYSSRGKAGASKKKSTSLGGKVAGFFKKILG